MLDGSWQILQYMRVGDLDTKADLSARFYWLVKSDLVPSSATIHVTMSEMIHTHKHRAMMIRAYAVSTRSGSTARADLGS